MIEVYIGEAASYKAAGVDIDAGDTVSRMWQAAARQTYDNRDDQFGRLACIAEDFSDLRNIDLDMVQGKTGLRLSVGVDGVGTKPELAERAASRRSLGFDMQTYEEERDHGGIFHDVVAMVADDIARDGGEPFAIATLFDARELAPDQSEKVVRQLCVGAVTACQLARVVYVNGETAELGERVGGYGPFNYNLGGFALGIAHQSRIVTGKKIQPGHSIVALREHGFRANGMNLVRKVLAAEFGENWHHDEVDLAGQALQPSIIYTPALVDMHGGYDLDKEPRADISAIIHVTGGGIPGKLQRKLAVNGYGAVLEDLFKPPDIADKIQEWSLKHSSLASPDASIYQSLNQGNGALVITPQPEDVLRVAETHGIESQVAGEVVEEPGIVIKSKGITNYNALIRYIPRAA